MLGTLNPQPSTINHQPSALIPASYLHLVGLHVGNTVHHETANTISPLVHSDHVPGLVQLICCSQTSGTRSDDGDLLASPRHGGAGHYPALLRSIFAALIHSAQVQEMYSSSVIMHCSWAARIAF